MDAFVLFLMERKNMYFFSVRMCGRGVTNGTGWQTIRMVGNQPENQDIIIHPSFAYR